jgi:hypothetical protein
MPTLLAVDLGLRTGLAFYHGDGRLAWYRSQHFGTRDALRRGVRGLLDVLKADDLGRIVLEGGGPIAEIWTKEVVRRGLECRQIAAEDWRKVLFLNDFPTETEQAKRRADVVARRVIEWSDAPRPSSLRHDAAEAILIGLWGVLDAGWLAAWPVKP